MAKILKAVIIPQDDGPPLVLLPGDDLPVGVVVTTPGIVEETTTPLGDDSEPRGNASREVWAEYAERFGITTADLTRNEIREAVNDLRSRG